MSFERKWSRIDCFVMTVRFWLPLLAGVCQFNYGEWLPRRSLVQRSPTECVSLNVIRCNNNHLQNKNKQRQSITSLFEKEYSFIKPHVLIPNEPSTPTWESKKGLNERNKQTKKKERKNEGTVAWGQNNIIILKAELLYIDISSITLPSVLGSTIVACTHRNDFGEDFIWL